jgi:DNA-binding NarL/FixJ family response regulator
VWPHFLAGQPDKPVRVLLVDDDMHMRRVIADEIMADPRTVLEAQAQTLREARRLARQHAFDVVLANLSLADGTALELITYIRDLRCAAKVVVVSALEGDEDALRAFALGAAGFLVKHCWFGGYVQAVLQVVNGGAAVSPSVARRLLQRLEPRAGDSPQPRADRAARLSEREREVLRMLSTGLTSSQIGGRLAISTMTVNTHVKNIYHKLQVRNRAQAVSFAASWGIL